MVACGSLIVAFVVQKKAVTVNWHLVMNNGFSVSGVW